jgi:hypothetical protein
MSATNFDTSEEDGPFITWLIRIGIVLVLLFGLVKTCSYKGAEQECKAICVRRGFAEHLHIPSTRHRGVVSPGKCYCATEEELENNKLKEENRAY